ncbi:MAG: four helix bundle protein [Bacteroidetes bacterium]|nr:MAG: four helix bundle protein [Bacteroidota bacterium]
MFPFEQLEVYKKAYSANQKVYRLLKEKSTIPPFVKNQLGRACLSIMLNIAEGSAKVSARDRKNFFVIARGSAFECSALINFLYDEGEVTDILKVELYSAFDEISRMLFTMIRNLNN